MYVENISLLSPVVPKPVTVGAEKASNAPVGPKPGTLGAEKASNAPIGPTPGTVGAEKASNAPTGPQPWDGRRRKGPQTLPSAPSLGR